MKDWIRIFLVSFVLIGSTAFFVYQYLNQFNNVLDSLSASSFAMAKILPVPFFDKTNKEQIPTTTATSSHPPATTTPVAATSTPETFPVTTSITTTTTPVLVSTSLTSTDLKISFVFPKISNVYIGCAYQLSFRSSTVARSLETVLVDAGSRDTVESVASGLAKEYKIESNSQSLDWKVGEVWPGEYYIKVSNINGIIRSKVFTIRKMPKGISVDERERICKESDGSF